MYCYRDDFYMKKIIMIKQNTKSHNGNLKVSTKNHGLESMSESF